ncbi:DUF2298 domain-containing protein [Halobacterium sp. KA-6]|jgi:YYY domain-containing protein|uniref:DUF2298 domain-containing protein n=1 Tax=Halobacterium sp. KA-6 TaxID=2896368 RepID=UPI001E328C39|nr:DUF2298 domain-containing protein [Halobacterium sp. KA-6]MCD2203716.1 DUF2298 domain-containing protein [Halobacterium sp. KA-6]
MEFLVLVSWLLIMAVLTTLGAPLAVLAFRSLPRRGAAFALPAALIPFAILVFWVGQFTFGINTILLSVVIIAGGASLAYRLGGQPDWRAVARMYGVFVVGFGIMVVFRASSPSITPAGGEQFLHFGLVNALERAPSLPPEDFWFAGKSLRYYYGTQLQVTSWSMLSATPLRYGFNLGIATFYGVLFVAAYGLVADIVHIRGYSYRLGGTLGAVFVAFAGPMTTPIRLLTPYLPNGIQGPVAQGAFGFVAARFYGGNLTKTVSEIANPLDWSWWYTRYVVPGTIQEVPLYSFVKGELHGHTQSTGYVLFAAALAYAYYRTPKEARLRRAAILFGGLGSVAGVFGFMNTWSLPTAGGLAVLAVAAADPHPATLLPSAVSDVLQPWKGRRERVFRVFSEVWRLVLAGAVGVGVILTGVAIASPFLVFGQVPRNNGIGFLPPRSALGPFLVIYLGLLSVVATYVALQYWPRLRQYRRGVLAAGAVVLFAAMATTTIFFDFAVLAIIGPILVGAWLLLRTGSDDFALVLIVAGLGLLLSYEVVYARLPATDLARWNTAMKVSVQGWILGAAGAGAAAATIISRASDRISSDQPPVDGSGESADTDGLSLGATFAVVVVVLALVSGLVFPTMVVGQEIGGEVAEGSWQPTLDGLDSLEQWKPAQAEAIHWLDNRPGTPTIVEATDDSYQFTSPASVFTGLPTVVGWDHQAEYRGFTAYNRRVDDVREIYTGTWLTAAKNLDRYDVQYIYVSPNERERYGEDLRSFSRSSLSVAFSNDKVTIYAVNQTVLPDG